MPGRSNLTRVDGRALTSYVVGQAERGEVLVIPGLCVSAYLRPAARALAGRGYRVHLLDPPGWPRSEPLAPEREDVAGLAAAVARWLEVQDLRGVALVGQSFGAQIAPHVAARVPDRVSSVVLQGPTFDPAYRTLGRALRRWARDFVHERPSLLAVEAPEWVRVGPRRVLRMVRASIADRLEDSVPAVGCPLLVAVGEHDPLSTRSWTTSLARLPAGPGAHVVMPGLPHSSPHADPEAFAELFVAFAGGGLR